MHCSRIALSSRSRSARLRRVVHVDALAVFVDPVERVARLDDAQAAAQRWQVSRLLDLVGARLVGGLLVLRPAARAASSARGPGSPCPSPRSGFDGGATGGVTISLLTSARRRLIRVDDGSAGVDPFVQGGLRGRRAEEQRERRGNGEQRRPATKRACAFQRFDRPFAGPWRLRCMFHDAGKVIQRRGGVKPDAPRVRRRRARPTARRAARADVRFEAGPTRV